MTPDLLSPTAHYDSELQALRSQLQSVRLENEKLRHDIAFLKTALAFEEKQAKQLAQRQALARRKFAGMQAEDERLARCPWWSYALLPLAVVATVAWVVWLKGGMP